MEIVRSKKAEQNMGHLLESSNPEAAAVMEGEYPRVPTGMPVRFITRQGSMRGGRTEFFATVMKQNEDGSVDLLVLMEPEDLVEERHINKISEHQVHQVWAPLVYSTQEIDTMMSDLFARIYGDFAEPEKSLMDYLADFDVRLRKLEKGKK
jgi:hypothetical protein